MYVALSSIINQPPINLRYPKVRVIPNKPLTYPPPLRVVQEDPVLSRELQLDLQKFTG